MAHDSCGILLSLRRCPIPGIRRRVLVVVLWPAVSVRRATPAADIARTAASRPAAAGTDNRSAADCKHSARHPAADIAHTAVSRPAAAGTGTRSAAGCRHSAHRPAADIAHTAVSRPAAAGSGNRSAPDCQVFGAPPCGGYCPYGGVPPGCGGYW